MSQNPGRLYLIPTLLAPGDPRLALPPETVDRIRSLRRFIVEGERLAWRFLAALMDRDLLAELRLELLDEHTPEERIPGLLAPALEGEDIGILSEAGLPCVADPGSALVALAHDRGLRVVPLSGPSSILLALAASGLDGQRFSFLGYLPADPAGRRRALLEIEGGLRADGATRIFIETPYRNDRLLADCLATLAPGTRLCVARSIGGETELISSAPVRIWRERALHIGKEPAVFLIGDVPGTSLDRSRGFGHSGTGSCTNKKR